MPIEQLRWCRREPAPYRDQGTPFQVQKVDEVHRLHRETHVLRAVVRPEKIRIAFLCVDEC